MLKDLRVHSLPTVAYCVAGIVGCVCHGGVRVAQTIDVVFVVDVSTSVISNGLLDESLGAPSPSYTVPCPTLLAFGLTYNGLRCAPHNARTFVYDTLLVEPLLPAASTQN